MSGSKPAQMNIPKSEPNQTRGCSSHSISSRPFTRHRILDLQLMFHCSIMSNKANENFIPYNQCKGFSARTRAEVIEPRTVLAKVEPWDEVMSGASEILNNAEGAEHPVRRASGQGGPAEKNRQNFRGIKKIFINHRWYFTTRYQCYFIFERTYVEQKTGS